MGEIAKRSVGGKTLLDMTSDATATAPDILGGKTAYVKGMKINGSGRTLQAMTADATATGADIFSGKTAYVNGSKIMGYWQNIVLGEMACGENSQQYRVGFPAAWDWGYLAFTTGRISGGSPNFIAKFNLRGTEWITAQFIKNNGFKDFYILDRGNQQFPETRYFDFGGELISGGRLSGYINWDSLSFRL